MISLMYSQNSGVVVVDILAVFPVVVAAAVAVAVPCPNVSCAFALDFPALYRLWILDRCIYNQEISTGGIQFFRRCIGAAYRYARRPLVSLYSFNSKQWEAYNLPLSRDNDCMLLVI
jgi:hypothetical protein